MTVSLKIGAIATALALGLIAPAMATTYTFDMTFNGTDISLDAGSDTPNNTVLDVGDSFTATVKAAAGDYWQVTSVYNQGFPLIFRVSDGAMREAQITQEFYKNSFLVDSVVETLEQGFIHVGAQNMNLAVGFEFDKVVLSWEFLSISDPVETRISATGADIFWDILAGTPFFRSSQIDYVFGDGPTPIPLPAAGWLMLAGLGGLGVAARRRRRTA